MLYFSTSHKPSLDLVLNDLTRLSVVALRDIPCFVGSPSMATTQPKPKYVCLKGRTLYAFLMFSLCNWGCFEPLHRTWASGGTESKTLQEQKRPQTLSRQHELQSGLLYLPKLKSEIQASSEFVSTRNKGMHTSPPLPLPPPPHSHNKWKRRRTWCISMRPQLSSTFPPLSPQKGERNLSPHHRRA
jgi:hypothetical protein